MTASANPSRSRGPRSTKKILSQLGNDVGNHTIIRSRRRAEDGNVGRQDLDDPLNPTVVGSEVVTPVADAVCLVHDEESHRPSQSRQDLGAEVEVVQTLRGHQEQIDLVLSNAFLDLSPFGRVVTVDRFRTHAGAARHLQLVAHQGEEG